MTLYKANKFKSKADKLGWTTEIFEGENEEVTVESRRGNEVVRMGWRGGKLLTLFEGQRDDCHYELPGVRKHQLNNIAGALRIMAEKPDYTGRSQSRKAATAGVELASRTDEELRSSLPYDDETPDQDILRALYGKTIVWRNSITGEFQEENVKPMIRDVNGHIVSQGNYNKHNYYIKKTSSGRRVLHFVGTTSFRAVALDRIMSVR